MSTMQNIVDVVESIWTIRPRLSNTIVCLIDDKNTFLFADGWVTVTPKRKQRMPKGNGASMDDEMFDQKVISFAQKICVLQNDDDIMMTDDGNDDKVIELAPQVQPAVVEKKEEKASPPPTEKTQPKTRAHKKKTEPVVTTNNDSRSSPTVIEDKKEVVLMH